MQLQPQELVVPASPAERDLGGCALAAESLRRFGELRFRAYGSSMLPAIWPGDVLRVKAAPANEAVVGEVWLTQQRGRLVAHRVISRNELHGVPSVTCRGDLLEREDLNVAAPDFLGRVVGIVVNGEVSKVPQRTRWNVWLAGWLRRSVVLRTFALRAHALQVARSSKRSREASEEWRSVAVRS